MKNFKESEMLLFIQLLGLISTEIKNLFGYYCLWGHENKGNWLQIFNDLINRGLKRTMIIVSDDFLRLDEAIKTLSTNRSSALLCPSPTQSI